MGNVGRSLVIISEETGGDVVPTLVVNNMRGILRCCAVNVSGSVAERQALLRRIAGLTGGTVLSRESGRPLEKATLGDLGRVRHVMAFRSLTVLSDEAVLIENGTEGFLPGQRVRLAQDTVLMDNSLFGRLALAEGLEGTVLSPGEPGAYRVRFENGFVADGVAQEYLA
ncbi:hypothetical protein ACFXKR_37170 [Streptomyces violascens]|uniref:hypothetical protein n=1 Tax=Streptomyces violascens TaxID=67381 RepID=UPI00369ED5AD